MAERRSDGAAPDASTLYDLVARVVGSGAVSGVRRARLVADGLQHMVVILDEELVARFPVTIMCGVDSRGGQVAGELFEWLEAVSFVHSPSLIHGDLAPYHH